MALLLKFNKTATENMLQEWNLYGRNIEYKVASCHKEHKQHT